MQTNHSVKLMFPGTKNEHYKLLVEDYRTAGGKWPTDMRTVAQWAIDEGRHEPRNDPAGDLARKLAGALRHELETDPQGRKIRRFHAIPAAAIESGKGPFKPSVYSGTQQFLWKEMDDATPSEMHSALALRRNHARGECRQIKMDAESFNENHNRNGQDIEMSFNFDMDFKEEEMPATYDYDGIIR